GGLSMSLRFALRLVAVALPCAAVLALLSGANATSAAGSGLVAAYSFDEARGTIVHDSSGNGNDGTIRGATWTSGKDGQALTFNGSNAWVTVPDTSSLDLTSALTLEAWVKPATSSNSWQTIVFKQGTKSLAYALYDRFDGDGPG